MSYATANEDTRPEQSVSAEYLKTAGKHLRESIDTKEYMLPDRRRANKEEAHRVYQEMSRVDATKAIVMSAPYVKNLGIIFLRSYSTIMPLGLEKMHDIISNDFIAGWDNMNLYGCVYDSFELFTILRNSISSIGEESWRAALRLRLEEKLVCSKKVTDDIQRLHDAYNNGVPLTNYTATPNGAYDSFYRTRELFPQTRDINMTYSRLRGHIKIYIGNIEGLHRILKNYDHQIEEIKYEYLNCTNGLWQASVEYDRELRVYQSLVIRQPMQRVIDRMRIFNNFKLYGFPKTPTLIDTIGLYDLFDIKWNSLFDSMGFQHVAFQNITDTIHTYWAHLNNDKYASKLSYAKVFTNDRVKKIVEQYATDVFPTTQNQFRKMCYDFTDLTQLHCQMYVRAMSDPLLKAFYFKFYDHFKKTTDSEREAMRTYFDFLNDSTLSSMLVRGTVIDVKTCIEKDPETQRILKYTTFLPKVTLFKDSMDKMESFLQTARLEGNVFRYFTIVS